MSARVARKSSRGICKGGRVIWAWLRGVFHDLVVVNAYVPHRGRKAPPFMEDTMAQIGELLRDKKRRGTAWRSWERQAEAGESGQQEGCLVIDNRVVVVEIWEVDHAL